MWNISSVITGIAVMIFYLGAFFCAGCLIPSRYCRNHFSARIMTGFLVYFSAFQLIAFPMKLLQRPLKHLTYMWFAFLLILAVYVAVFRRKAAIESLVMPERKKGDIPAGILLVLMILALAAALGMNVNHISDYDAGYYIGLPVSSVYSNTIELMDPYTGGMLSVPSGYYLFNTFTVHSAVSYQALNIHPLIEQKFSMTMALVVVFMLTLYQGGKILFDEDRKKSVLFCWISAAALLGSYSIAGTSHYFAYRTYEGKSVCAYLLVSMLTVFFFSLYRDSSKGWGSIGMLLTGVCGAAFCNTAIYIVPVMTGLLLATAAVTRRKWSMIPQSLVILLPSAGWLLGEVLR